MSKEKNNSPLTLCECTIIEVKYRYGGSMTAIAEELSRNKSTISREIGGKPARDVGKYGADIAHRKALKRIEKRGNISKLEKNSALKKYVEEKLTPPHTNS